MWSVLQEARSTRTKISWLSSPRMTLQQATLFLKSSLKIPSYIHKLPSCFKWLEHPARPTPVCSNFLTSLTVLGNVHLCRWCNRCVVTHAFLKKMNHRERIWGKWHIFVYVLLRGNTMYYKASEVVRINVDFLGWKFWNKVRPNLDALSSPAKQWWAHCWGLGSQFCQLAVLSYSP